MGGDLVHEHDVAEGWVVEFPLPKAEAAEEQGSHHGDGVLGQM